MCTITAKVSLYMYMYLSVISRATHTKRKIYGPESIPPHLTRRHLYAKCLAEHYTPSTHNVTRITKSLLRPHTRDLNKRQFQTESQSKMWEGNHCLENALHLYCDLPSSLSIQYRGRKAFKTRHIPPPPPRPPTHTHTYTQVFRDSTIASTFA